VSITTNFQSRQIATMYPVTCGVKLDHERVTLGFCEVLNKAAQKVAREGTFLGN
jgi:hypothetical protein